MFYVIETDQTGYKSSIGRYRFNPEPIEDVNDKKYVKELIFDLLSKEYHCDETNISMAIPFDDLRLNENIMLGYC